MEFQSFFPLSMMVRPREGKTVLTSLLCYCAILLVLRVAVFLLGWLILVGPIVRIAATIAGLYCTIGLLLSLLIYYEVV